jgi:hypothetical protein
MEMKVDAELLKKQLADMEAQRTAFQQSYWQADGACQALASMLRIAEQPEPEKAAPPPETQPNA